MIAHKIFTNSTSAHQPLAVWFYKLFYCVFTIVHSALNRRERVSFERNDPLMICILGPEGITVITDWETSF